MKTFLFLFLFCGSLIAGDISQMLVERKIIGTATNYQVTAYGILDNGQPKVFTLTSPSDMKMCSDIESNPAFSLGATPIRFWVFFLGKDLLDDKGVAVKAKGSIDRIDFHKQPSPNFESKIVDPKQADAKTEVADLKLAIEDKAK